MVEGNSLGFAKRVALASGASGTHFRSECEDFSSLHLEKLMPEGSRTKIGQKNKIRRRPLEYKGNFDVDKVGEKCSKSR